MVPKDRHLKTPDGSSLSIYSIPGWGRYAEVGVRHHSTRSDDATDFFGFAIPHKRSPAYMHADARMKLHKDRVRCIAESLSLEAHSCVVERDCGLTIQWHSHDVEDDV